MKCKKHPKYKAILQPRVDCVECWFMWEAAVQVRLQEIRAKIMELLK